MYKKYNDQKGIIAILLILVLFVTIAIAGVILTVYFISNKSSSKKVVTSQNTVSTKLENFSSTQKIFDAVSRAIDSTSLDVKLASSTISDNSKPGTDYSLSTAYEYKTFTFKEGTQYKIERACIQTCDKLSDGSPNILLDSPRLSSVVSNVKSALLDHSGVSEVSSGSLPSTYLTVEYFVLKIVLADGTTTNVQVSLQGNDGGQFLNAYTY